MGELFTSAEVQDAIGLYIEYVEVHGYKRAAAIEAAINELLEARLYYDEEDDGAALDVQ